MGSEMCIRDRDSVGAGDGGTAADHEATTVAGGGARAAARAGADAGSGLVPGRKVGELSGPCG